MLRSIVILGRGIRAILKYGLAGFGACLLVQLYLDRWGGPATVWLFGAPFVYGFVRTIRAHLATPPAPPGQL